MFIKLSSNLSAQRKTPSSRPIIPLGLPFITNKTVLSLSSTKLYTGYFSPVILPPQLTSLGICCQIILLFSQWITVCLFAGCGLCIAEEKLLHQLNKVKKESAEPQKIRGMELSEISMEKMSQQRAEQAIENKKMRYWSIAGILAFLSFFAGLTNILNPCKTTITDLGVGFQMSVIVLLMIAIHSSVNFAANKISFINNKIITNMLIAYAFICLLITFVYLNHFSADLFLLAE